MTDYWILDLFFLLPSRYVSWNNTKAELILASLCPHYTFWSFTLYFIIQKYQQCLVFDNLPSGPSPAASLLLLVPALTGQLTGHVLPHPAQSLLQLLWYLRLHPGNVPITTLLSVISLFIYLTSLKNCFLAATNIPSSESRTNWTILYHLAVLSDYR